MICWKVSMTCVQSFGRPLPDSFWQAGHQMLQGRPPRAAPALFGPRQTLYFSDRPQNGIAVRLIKRQK